MAVSAVNLSAPSRPFLKWAGNKFRMLEQLHGVLPLGPRLIDPFLGSGAVFLNTSYPGYLLADGNANLINLYNTLKSHGTSFIEDAQAMFTSYTNEAEAYYELREEYNSSADPYRRAVLFVYLNRHCFNGLFRENQSGGFNVPFGRYVNPKFPLEGLTEFLRRANNVEFLHQDFLDTMDLAKEGDVVYCDPPYAPLSATATFRNYTATGFGNKDHEALASKAKELQDRGVRVIVSNHDTPFTRELYKDAHITSFGVQRFISRDPSKRVKAPELLACYYP